MRFTGGKADAKGNKLTYQYDSYNRLTSVTWANAPGGAQVLRSYMYDTNTLDSTFSGSYTQGRLVAVQNAQFTPGNGGLVNWVQLVEMYGYTQPGSVSGKRLQANEHIPYPVGYGQTLTRNLDAAYTYDNEGKMTSAGYPTTWTYTGGGVAQPTPGPTYSYSFDSMSRLAGMTDQNNNTNVSNVTYNAANQLTGITYFGSPETRTYNSLGQMTQLYVNSGLYYNYNYPAGPNNNGKISSTYEALSGETISYTYDSLNRMATAAGSGWAETYGYDGFGNLATKTPTLGTPPSLSQAANQTNNQIVGYSYDANGNQLGAPGFYGSPTYDVENRMVAAPGVQYAYDSQNKRVWTATVDSSNNLTGQTANFYGVNGQKIGSYSLAVNYGVGQLLEFADPPTTLAVYFGGKRVATTQGGTTTSYWQDRLGSNRGSGSRYYPWGEDRSTPSNDQVRFATYTRDSATLLDYADQRYYGNAQGRFMTPDPYSASGGTSDPGSWNRYAYTRGDPVNRFDPEGMFDCPENTTCMTVVSPGVGPLTYNSLVYASTSAGVASTNWYASQISAAKAAAQSYVTAFLTAFQAQTLLGARLNNFASSHCANVFASVIQGYSTSDFIQDAQSDEFFSARGGAYSNMTQNQVVGNGVSTTLNGSVPFGIDAATIWGPLGTAILLGPNYFSNTNSSSQENTLLHEVLHGYTEWSDGEVFSNFAGYGLQHIHPGTVDITDWLKNDCTKTDPTLPSYLQ